MFRRGVLVGSAAARVAAHHDALAAVGYAFGLAVLALGLFGVATAAVQRRWGLLALLPFQLSLTATYTIFFAEPRYRLPIEMLAFPFVALALAELVRFGVARRAPGLGAVAPPAGAAGRDRHGAGPAFSWSRVVTAGQALRTRHRWAATEVALSIERAMVAAVAGGAAAWSSLAAGRRAEGVTAGRC